jgi:hypothetical protein
MAVTAAFSVKRALVAALRELPNLDGIQISYGWPGDDKAEGERIFVGRARVDQEPGPMKTGRVHRREEGTVEVMVFARAVGGTSEEAEARVEELAREVEECVADNRNLGNDLAAGITVNETTMRGVDVQAGYNSEGHMAQATYSLQWTAYLT